MHTQYITCACAHIHHTHIMNNYSDNTALYDDILREDAVYNSLQRIQRKAKNARRSQRKQREAQRNRVYDTY